MEAVGSAHFRMYWQPFQWQSAEQNLKNAQMIAFYAEHLHVFHWKKEKKLPMDKAKFYLPEEQRFTAELRYSEVRNPIGSFIITVAIAIGAAFFAKFAAPELLQMLDNFLTMM
jgi:hypothetical protein